MNLLLSILENVSRMKKKECGYFDVITQLLKKNMEEKDA